MDPFSISLGALSIIDVCLKYGKVLVGLYDDHKNAEVSISETLLKLKVIWFKTETQMTFLRKIWDSLDSNYQYNQHLLLSILQNKLKEAVSLLNTVIGAKNEHSDLGRTLLKKGTLKKGKYALHVKGSLDKTLSELIDWHSLFDPSWYLLARIPGGDVDHQLESHGSHESTKLLAGLRKSVQDLRHQTSGPPRPISANDFLESRVAIPGSSSLTARFQGKMQLAIVDTMVLNLGMDPTGTTRSTIALARVLSRMEPSTFGLLRCCGVINKGDRYEFVMEIPRGLQNPRSLRDLLGNYQPTLNMKLEVAKQLANSVLYLHAAGFVHKNIRPETILVFDHGESKSSFLVGFENFRGVKDETIKQGDSVPARELYRHPTRQGDDPERPYVMQHDIYSLGVCLLEIGMWKSFVEVQGDSTVIEFDPDIPVREWRRRAFEIKRELLAAAGEKLSLHTGRRFQDIVERCLSCLDEETTWDEVEEKGPSEINVGLEFIENVLLELHEIAV